MKYSKKKEISKLKKEIDKLPKGNLFYKTINGKSYCYHQYSYNGQRISTYIKKNDVDELNKKINKRMELENRIKELEDTSSNLLLATLKHKDIDVIDIYINQETGLIEKVGNLYNPNHLPLGVNDIRGHNIKQIKSWWQERSIPLSRSGIKEAMEKLEISTPTVLLTKCYGLSLSDHFWIKPHNLDIKWDDVNFFTNEFSDDLGKILLGSDSNGKKLDLSSPDNTSIGNLKKRWKIIDGKRYLIKGGSSPYRQEPLNEVVASKIMDILEIPHVEYSLIWDEGLPYSVCKNFIGADEDLVTAHQISTVLKKLNSDSSYQHLLDCCDYLGMKMTRVINYIDRMLVVDFIIANEDRHFNNFGFIQDIKSLEFINFAPLFDNGSSFGYNKIAFEIKPFRFIETKPFKTDILKQLELVTSLNYLGLTNEKLDRVKEVIVDEFTNTEYPYLDEQRRKAIIDAAIVRIDYLKNRLSKELKK